MSSLWLATFTIQIIHLLYQQITTLIDLYPFNNIRGITAQEKLLESSINGFTMIIPIIALLSGNKLFMNIGLVLLGIVCIGEFFTWWYPYLFGATKYWQEQYDLKFRSTIIVLPPIKNHPIPNLEHMILHLLTLSAFITMALVMYRG